MKVIKSLENRGILIKGTSRKITRQEGGFSNFFRPFITSGLPLMKIVFTPAKISLLPLGLSAGISTADAAIQKKIYGSGTATFIISNEEMNDIMKIVKSLEESGLSIKGVNETIKNGTLALSMLGSTLTGRGVIRAGEGAIRADKGTVRAGESF